MKYIAALACLLLTTIAAPAFAHEPTDTCTAKAEKIANPAEREAFMKSCVAEAGSPESVAKAKKHDKEHHCDTNAKSMNLEGKKKQEYLEHCYKENDFKKDQKPHPKM
jgi:hypothetical protein